jgi:nitrilase
VCRAGRQRHLQPVGEIVAGPLRQEESILTAEVDLTRASEPQRLFDPVGHYHRSDVLQLTVDTRPRHAVMLVSEDAASDN